MHDLPISVLSTVDIRDASSDGYLLSSKREFPALDTQFVAHVSISLNELTFKRHLTI